MQTNNDEQQTITPEVVYQWKEPIDDDGTTRYVTPRGNGRVYEWPWDFMYESPEAALEHVLEYAEVDDTDDEFDDHNVDMKSWVLFRVEYTKMYPLTEAPK